MLPIGSIILAADIEPAKLSMEDGYQRLIALVDRLATLSPRFKTWSVLPESPKEKRLSLAEREAVLARIGKEREAAARKYPILPNLGGFTTDVSNVGLHEAWEEAGRCDLSYHPVRGSIRFDFYRPVEVFGEETRRIVEGVLLSICELEDVSFANCNVITRKTAERERLSYQQDFATFPHRKYLGWMGFVPRALRKADIPEAASVAVVEKKGSVLVAVPGMLDLGNPADIKSANLLEMKLVDLDLLPVTDPNFQ